jgi:SAM-dependent methyltransferase
LSVFNTHYADQYDRLYASKDYGGECDLVQSALQRFCAQAPQRLLDVGCGTGGHAIELARRGYQMTGVDLSAAMLEHARHKAEVLGPLQPRWVCGDARNFDAGEPYDAAIMMFAVIGYLNSNEDVLAGLRNIRRHLKPGAVFVCDFWYGPTVLMQGPSDRVRVLDVDEGQVIRTTQTTLDVVKHTADVSFRLWHVQGQQLLSQTEETHRLRYFFPQEFSLLLAQAGFRQDSLSAFPSLEAPLANDSWNALVVATAV